MPQRTPALRRAALRTGLLLILAPAVLGQTPPGMVAVPSFDTLPVPSETPANRPRPAPATGVLPDTRPYSSRAEDCGPDPSPVCIARALARALGALPGGADGGRFSLSEAQSRPCPADVNVLWDNCAGRITPNGGGVYDGTFRSDQRHGVGVYRFADGETYSGQWKDNKQHGRGETVLVGGDRYVGEYREGHATGKGTYIWADTGNRYVGDFVELIFSGRGILYGPDGRVLSAGEWKEDELIRTIALNPANYPFTQDFGMVPVPATARTPSVALPSQPAPAPAPGPAPAPANGCTPGPALEAREYASPEYIGAPEGRRARMCFYRSNGRDVEQLRFFPGGIFYQTSQTGSGGFAMSGAVLQTIRGTYGFTADGTLRLRIAYSGTGVTQTTRGAGSTSTLDVAGARPLATGRTLPNCQTISLSEETRRASFGSSRGGGHPDHVVLDGVRWERDTDCGDWEGWK